MNGNAPPPCAKATRSFGNRSNTPPNIIEQIAQAAEISKSAAERSVDALVNAVKTSLRKGEEVTLVGFGTFYAGSRAARTGRNPRTGEAVEIKAAKLPKFRAGKALKDAIN